MSVIRLTRDTVQPAFSAVTGQLVELSQQLRHNMQRSRACPLSNAGLQTGLAPCASSRQGLSLSEKYRSWREHSTFERFYSIIQHQHWIQRKEWTSPVKELIEQTSISSTADVYVPELQLMVYTSCL